MSLTKVIFLSAQLPDARSIVAILGFRAIQVEDDGKVQGKSLENELRER